MKKLNFSEYKINVPEKKVLSERSEVIGMFLEKLNSDRKPPFKPLSASRVGMLLSPIKSVKDLRAFYSECLYQNNFSRFFWYRCNPKKHI